MRDRNNCLSKTRYDAEQWGKNDDESLELRVVQVVAYLANIVGANQQWDIDEIEAIGKCGSLYAEKLLRLTSSQLIELFNKGGQVIEFRGATESGKVKAKLIMQDGCYVDVMVKGIEIPDQTLGKYIMENADNFHWS